MNQLALPPPVFEFAPDVPEGVEVYADPNCVRITVAPPRNREERLPVIFECAYIILFMCLWCTGAAFIIFPLKSLWISLILASIFIVFVVKIGLKYLRYRLSSPTVFLINGVNSVRFDAGSGPVYEPKRLELRANDLYYHRGRTRESYLRGYPALTRLWVEREFNRAGQWASDWLTHRVTVAAAVERAQKAAAANSQSEARSH